MFKWDIIFYIHRYPSVQSRYFMIHTHSQMENLSDTNDLKVVEERLKLLDLAETSGNISTTCRQLGVSRTQYYEYKRRYKQQGIEGLVNRSSAHHSHPFTTPLEVEQRILVVSLEHPSWGCNKLCDQLTLEEINRQASTIQKILKKNGMGTAYERYLQLEEILSQTVNSLTDEQVVFVEKYNPAFRERNEKSNAPGEMLCQDTISVGHLPTIGKVYVHTVLDTYSCYAFCLVSTTRKSGDAVVILEDIVLPFFIDQELNTKVVVTGSGNAFKNEFNNSYMLCLNRNHIRQRRPKHRPWTNGFIERFKHTAIEEFFRKALPTGYDSIQALQVDLDSWLRSYNHERLIQGYPNFGKRPIDRIKDFQVL